MLYFDNSGILSTIPAQTGEVMTNSTANPTDQPADGESSVLFVCDPHCARIEYNSAVVEGKVAASEGPKATTREIALAQATRENLVSDSLCTAWRWNGVEGCQGWCFLNKK